MNHLGTPTHKLFDDLNNGLNGYGDMVFWNISKWLFIVVAILKALSRDQIRKRLIYSCRLLSLSLSLSLSSLFKVDIASNTENFNLPIYKQLFESKCVLFYIWIVRLWRHLLQASFWTQTTKKLQPL